MTAHVNGTDAPGPAEFLAHWASLTPDRTAVVSAGGDTSYAELDRLVDEYANRLYRHGVRRGDRVCVLLERDLDSVAVELALLRSGVARVPLDSRSPRARHELVIEDMSPALLVTLRRFGSDGWGAPVLHVDAEPAAGTGTPWRRPEVSAADTAYVMYTSGSTGRPKGVSVSHGSLRNLLAAQRDVLRLEPADRVLQPFPPSFDMSVWDLGAALGAGATCVLPDGDDVVAAARRHGVTVLSASPSMLAGVALDRLPALHTVVNCGEACPPDLAKRIAPRFRYVNAYGPTEVTVIATVHVIDPENPVPRIGRPLPGVTATVLDGQLLPRPPGVPGELYLGGVAVGDGYHGRPALTAERFLPDPYAGRPGARMYRTGDLARAGRDGALDFLGRVDHQLKVRGLRIEPGEIEAVLRRHPGVQHAVVVAIGEADQRRLVGYVAAPGPVHVDAGELRALLTKELPRYLVPGTLVILPELPLTRSRKVDRAALPPPGAGSRPRLTTPRTPVEEALVLVCRRILGREDVGTLDNFFDLGGDSVGATQVVAALRQEGWTVTVDALFGTATLEDLAGTAEAVRRAPVGATASIDDEARRKLTHALGGLDWTTP